MIYFIIGLDLHKSCFWLMYKWYIYSYTVYIFFIILFIFITLTFSIILSLSVNEHNTSFVTILILFRVLYFYNNYDQNVHDLPVFLSLALVLTFCFSNLGHICDRKKYSLYKA